MYVIKLYKIKKCSLKKTEDVLSQVKKLVNQLVRKRYIDLLSREIEVYIDDMVLNHFNRPEKSIFECVKEILNKKIAVSIAHKDNNEYNLSCSVNVLTFENDTYIELLSGTEMYDNVFPKIDGIEDMSIEDDDLMLDSDDNKYELWKKIANKYKHENVLGMRIYPSCTGNEGCNNISFEDLHFNSPEVRAETRARHHLTNVLLSGYASGEQIPPHKLMEYMDYALLRTSDAIFIRTLKDQKNMLVNTLPTITEEMVFCV